MPGGTTSTIRKFRAVFKACDEDQDGFLGAEDLTKMMATLGGSGLDDGEVESWVREFGTTKDGKVNFTEFLSLAATRLDRRVGAQPTLHQVFDVFDKKQVGMIEPNELMAVFKDLGADATQEEISAMFELVDSDYSGEIDFEEFLKIVERLQEAELQGGRTEPI